MTMADTPDPIARFVFFAVMGCWILFVLTFALRKSLPKGEEKRRDRTALVGIGLQMAGYFLVWFGPLERKFFSPVVPMPRAAEIAVALLTVGIAAASVWMVNAAVRRLGRQWAVAARLVEGHNLITDGPYRFIRNPIYTGMFGLLVATGLAVTQWGAIIPAVVLFLAGTFIRVRTEERLLREYFGTEFDEYTRRVPAVIPGIW